MEVEAVKEWEQGIKGLLGRMANAPEMPIAGAGEALVASEGGRS